MMTVSKFSRKAILAAALVSASHGSAAFAQASTTPPADDVGQEVIVTGTRTTGMRAADSPAPIQLLGADALKRVGQPDLNNILAQQLPSIQVQAFGNDQTAFHPSVKLRGLSPNHTLVEVNGKRRHGTSNVNVVGGPYGGAAAPDLSLIPVAAIDHVEVLQDGAAAQYGTDAIAGVVNFILKKNPGFSADATGGRYIDQGGARYDFQARVGAQPIEGLNISLVGERSFKNYSFRGAEDPRVFVIPGYSSFTAARSTLLTQFPGITSYPNYPFVNRIVGDGRLRITNGLANLEYDAMPELTVYAFGTYSHKVGRTYQNYRLPNVVVGKQTLFTTTVGVGDYPFPSGFSPQEVTRETDYQVTGGAKGEIMDTTYDISSSYSRDINNSFVERSANAALYFDSSTTTSKGYSPSTFFDGAFVFSQWTNNLDLTHKFDLGLASPLNVAGGLEYRRENYILRAGDPASYYISPYATTQVINPNTGVATTVNARQGGAQSFFGYSPANASNNFRKVFAQYIDLSIKPVEQWLVDGAVRHEHYSDFGSTTVFKLTSRYDFSPQIAVRGTASTGFRAPTLAEAFYSGINVGPTALSGVFAPNSAGARSLGLSGLKAEKSTSFSAGIVAHPVSRLTVTLDGYYIRIRNRIVQSGSFFGANYNRGVPVAGTVTSQSVLDALRAVGVPVDSVLSTLMAGATNGQSGSITLQTFVNGVKTTTTGFDFQANYSSDFGNYGKVDWGLSANYNKTKINSISAPPSGINQAALLLDPAAQSTLTDTTPKFRATGSAYYQWRKFFLSFRESFYGQSSQITADPNTGLYTVRLLDKRHFITDLEVGVNLTKFLRLSGGANNLFNVRPTPYPDDYRAKQYANNSTGYITRYPTWSPIGINGGYYYGRLSLNF